MEFKFKSAIWLYPGKAGWHFVTLPKPVGLRIKGIFGGYQNGFGSLKVKAEILGHIWDTSIFPDSKSGSYLLPIKSAIRKQTGLLDGQHVNVKINILV